MIKVLNTSDLDPMHFEVTIQEDGGHTQHAVTLARNDWMRLAGPDHTPEQCVQAAFRFLLEREPKESILARFDLPLIGHYFPEFEQELKRYL